MAMAQVKEIKHAIEELSEEEFLQIREWFIKREWEEWDEQIKRDSKDGKLDFLIKEAHKEKSHGKLKSL